MPIPSDAATADDHAFAEPRRHVVLPVLLLLVTCLSTFWTGAANWNPVEHLDAVHRAIGIFAQNWRQGAVSSLQQAMAVAELNWRQGLVYMGVVMALLVAHEMGHFLMALRHRIPASLPYFIPLPIAPFGTLGAVIGMEGSRANRREMFDLGLAGPLAGLALTVPVTWIGIKLLPVAPASVDGLRFHNPLLLHWMIAWLRPGFPTPGELSLSQFNPFLMAGWVGMFITGLNMLPISQLDGGHVAYAVLGRRRAHGLARGLLVVAIAYIVITGQYSWIVMLMLVILVGADHPPTADDRYPIGWPRRLLGWAALAIPVLCFNPWVITPGGR